MLKLKSSIASVTVIAFLATGMVFANTSATLPGVTPETFSSAAWAPVAASVLPGVQSTQETPNEGISHNGGIPGIGVHTNEIGSVAPHTSILPGIASAETLASNR